MNRKCHDSLFFLLFFVQIRKPDLNFYCLTDEKKVLVCTYYGFQWTLIGMNTRLFSKAKQNRADSRELMGLRDVCYARLKIAKVTFLNPSNSMFCLNM